MGQTKLTRDKQKPTFRDNSRPLDVHRWSDWPEVNDFVGGIYNDYFKTKHTKVEREHVKLLLLDLYVNWKESGAGYLSVHMSPNAYKAKGSRYNKLHISKKTIDVVNKLEQLELIEKHTGFFDRATGSGYVTRINPTHHLISRFLDARFPEAAIQSDPDQECIIIHDSAKKPVEYTDSKKIQEMRGNLRSYNDLLKKTHIDCANLEKPVIHRKDGAYVRTGDHNKFVRRIFNNMKCTKGGRFYGGFWQQIPSEFRQHIRINGGRTVEVDYSGLHIILLYAREGFNYWGEVNTDDPYGVDLPELDAADARYLAKNLLLMAINSKDETSTFNALRSEMNIGGRITNKLTNELLKEVLDQLTSKHPIIADKLCSGAGIDLQYIDSQMTEKLMMRFTERGIPLLSVHDSYIVPHQYALMLRDEMDMAFDGVTKLSEGVEGFFELSAKEGTAIKQIGYDDEYLRDVDDELSSEEREHDPAMITHKQVMNEVDKDVHHNHRNRLILFREYLNSTSNG
jgi:hypothetical protein